MKHRATLLSEHPLSEYALSIPAMEMLAGLNRQLGTEQTIAIWDAASDAAKIAGKATLDVEDVQRAMSWQKEQTA